ncbi:MAG: HdeD family acid-resistance protein [Bacteroidales bacterium]|nr:HdeD family acid-resistance protein [Bacteroidales bacterium]
MATNFFKTIKNSVKHWYLTLIVGIIFVGIGILVFFTPLESYVGLALLFSISFLVGGIFEIVFSISNRKVLDGWGWNLALGILTFLVGLVLIDNPEISMVTLPFMVGFVVLYRSIMAISLSFELRNYHIMDWGYMLGLGILGTLFSFILVFNPGFAGLSMVVWTGLAFVTVGIFNIYFSLKLKKLHDLPETISGKLKEKYNEVKEQIQQELSSGAE